MKEAKVNHFSEKNFKSKKFRNSLLILISCIFFNSDNSPLKNNRIPASSEEDCEMLLMGLSKGLSQANIDLEAKISDTYLDILDAVFKEMEPEKLESLFNPDKEGLSQFDFRSIYNGVKYKRIKLEPKEEKLILSIGEAIYKHGGFFWRTKDLAQEIEKFKNILNKGLKRSEVEEKISLKKPSDTSPEKVSSPPKVAKERVLSEAEDLKESKKNKNNFQKQTFNSSSNKVLSQLEAVEISVLKRALGEHSGNKYSNSKWYSTFKNHFFPHYNRILSLNSYNNNVRRNIQHAVYADAPYYNILAKHEQDLTNVERALFEGFIQDTSVNLKDIKSNLRALYGNELGYISEDSIELREIYKRIKDSKASEELQNNILEEERNLDQLDKFLDRIHLKKTGEEGSDLPKRDLTELTSEHLKIRHSQFIRETPMNKESYLDITNNQRPQNSEIEVRTSWTTVVTTRKSRTVTDSEGNLSTEYYNHTDYYPQSRIDRVSARTEDILANNFIIRDSDIPEPGDYHGMTFGGSYISQYNTGVSSQITHQGQEQFDRIVQSAYQVTQKERPWRDNLDNISSYLDEFEEKYRSEISESTFLVRESVDKLENIEKGLDKNILEITEYLASDIKQVSERWPSDTYGMFLDRNNKLLFRLEEMNKRVTHLKAQLLKGEKNLDLEFNIPQYAEDLERLKKIHQRNRIIDFTTGGVLVTAGGFAAYDIIRHQNDYEYEGKLNAFFEKVFGKEND